MRLGFASDAEQPGAVRVAHRRVLLVREWPGSPRFRSGDHLPPAWGGRFTHFGSERVGAAPNEPWHIAKMPLRQARLLVVAAASCATSFVTRRLPVLDVVPLPYSLDDHSPARFIEVSRASLPPALAEA